MNRAWVREYWPFLVGVAIIILGNIYLYGVLGQERVLGGMPFLAAIVVVLLLEIGRAAYRRFA